MGFEEETGVAWVSRRVPLPWSMGVEEDTGVSRRVPLAVIAGEEQSVCRHVQRPAHLKRK